MTLTTPSTGPTLEWGTAVSAPLQNTIYSASPPPGALDPLPASTTDDATAIVQAHLGALETAGGGRVVIEKPGSSARFLTGLVVPPKVQLVSDENTLLDFSQMSSGAAITVDDDNFTPLVGVRMDGGMFTPTSSDLASAYTGIDVTGHGLKLEKCHLQYFGRAVDCANSSTFGVTLEDFTIDHCANGWFLDIEGTGAGNSGEKMLMKGGSIANTVRGFHATGNGMNVKFDGVSHDFCTLEIGKVNNAHVDYVNCHVETNTGYLFDVTGNSLFDFTDTRFVLSKAILFKAGQGPADVHFGSARFKNCRAFFTQNNDAAANVRSEHSFNFPSGTTAHSLYVPWALKWTPISANFVFLDGADGGPDTLRVSSMTSSTGQVNLTASASSGSARPAILRFG